MFFDVDRAGYPVSNPSFSLLFLRNTRRKLFDSPDRLFPALSLSRSLDDLVADLTRIFRAPVLHLL